jgi:hypothetical protein
MVIVWLGEFFECLRYGGSGCGKMPSKQAIPLSQVQSVGIEAYCLQRRIAIYAFGLGH